MTEQGKAEQSRVHVTNLKTNERAKFHMDKSATIQEVWDQAYSEFEEKKGPNDSFQCADGEDLTAHLSKTLQELRDSGICKNRKFEIRGPTGGASNDN